MREHELRAPAGSHKRRRRVGRGNSSGRGTYAGKGSKGQKARSGAGPGASFEGGQLSLVKRLPHKPGFKNLFRIEYEPVNLAQLVDLPAGAEVTPETLRERGIIRSIRKPIVILADGEIEQPLTVRAHRISRTAREKIEAAGGTIDTLPKPVIHRPR
jgi:large subunit ribosomal protein L15